MWFSWWPTLFFLFCITTKIRKWSQVEILPSMQDQDQPELVSLGDTEKTRNIRDRRCIVPRKSLAFLYSSFGVGASSTYLDVSPTLLHIDASLFCWKECLHVHGRDVVRSLKCFLWSHLLTTEAQTPSQHARYNNKEVLVAFLVAAWHGVVTDRDRCAAFFLLRSQLPNLFRYFNFDGFVCVCVALHGGGESGDPIPACFCHGRRWSSAEDYHQAQGMRYLSLLPWSGSVSNSIMMITEPNKTWQSGRVCSYFALSGRLRRHSREAFICNKSYLGVDLDCTSSTRRTRD